MQVIIPIPIHMDNEGIMCMDIYLVANNISKHIHLMYRLIRDFVNKGVINLECIGTNRNIVDILNKPSHEVSTITVLTCLCKNKRYEDQ